MKVVWDGRYTYIYTNPDSYEPLAQVRNWTTEDGESRQQTHYFHCDQIGIPREMTDKDGNLLWFGNYTGWGRLKEETKVTDSAYQPFRLQNQYADRETGLHYNFFRYYEPAGMASAPGNYFVRGYAVRSARGNARAFNDSVQVRHSGNATAARDMRKQLHIFVVEEDICVGKSKAKANKKYGDGGATQYYIRDMDKPKLTSTGNLRSFRR